MLDWEIALIGLGVGIAFTTVADALWRSRNVLLPKFSVIKVLGAADTEWAWSVDQFGIFTSSDSASLELTGYEPAELIGRSAEMLMDPQELVRATSMMNAMGSPDVNPGKLVVAVRHRDGTSSWFEITIRRQMDTTGGTVGFEGKSRRIGEDTSQLLATQQKQARISAIIAGQLLMTAFQPIVDLSSGKVVGVEALSRIVAEPAKTPDIWFTDAASVGLGAELELLAVQTALTATASLPEDLYVSINVSPETCLDGRLLTMMTQSSLDLRRLVLELTEHSPVPDYEPLKLLLGIMQGLGIRIAIDDAGAGFASGQHILQIRPQLIKLDQSIVRRIDTDPGQQALAAGVVALAAEIGATVTAEGIETRAELKCVTDLGVAAGQGYFLGRPTVRPREWTRWKARTPDRRPVDPAGRLQAHREAELPAPPSASFLPELLQAGQESGTQRNILSSSRYEPIATMHDDPGAALVIAEEPGLALAVLDALPDATAVLDYSGTIIAVNSAWRAFAFDNGGSATDTGPGVNYLKVCARSAATGDRDAADILGCLRAVLSGEAVECELEYPCDSPDEQRWFRARFTAIGAHGGAAVSSHVNISRRKRAELELVHRASYDPLTGLANRVLFIETLTEFLDCRPGRVLAQPDMAQPDIAQPDRAQPDRVEPRTTHGIPAQVGTTRRVGLLYLGLDQFTLINDDFGHAVGDELLLATTRRLRQLVRDGDTVARLGGDEFAVCAPGITEDELTAMAERIGSALAEPYLVHGEQLRVGASLGVYLSAPGDTAAGAIHWADQAMYLVKNTRLPA